MRFNQENQSQSSRSFLEMHINNLIKLDNSSNQHLEILASIKPIFLDIYNLILSQKKYNPRNTQTNKQRQRKKILSEEEKCDLVEKINKLTWAQVHELKNYLPTEMYNEGNISIKINKIPRQQLFTLYSFVNDCTVTNKENPDYKSWRELRDQVKQNFILD
jgi:hypothetical protein